jgi:hypothetical protein
MPSFQSCIWSGSTSTPVTLRPIEEPAFAFSYRWAAEISALEGMQPQLRHTPPGDSFSMQSVFCLSWARRIAQG